MQHRSNPSTRDALLSWGCSWTRTPVTTHSTASFLAILSKASAPTLQRQSMRMLCSILVRTVTPALVKYLHPCKVSRHCSIKHDASPLWPILTASPTLRQRARISSLTQRDASCSPESLPQACSITDAAADQCLPRKADNKAAAVTDDRGEPNACAPRHVSSLDIA